MKTVDRSMSFHERLFVLVDEYPWSVCGRMVVGFLIAPLLSLLCNDDNQMWCMAGLFMGILFSLRLGATIFRKLVPFSREVHVIWAERRQLAKRFDSYQWQKLFWMGIGMTLHAMISGKVGNGVGALMLFCLVGGGIGVFSWARKNVRAAVLH
jgi:hypothetical protein